MPHSAYRITVFIILVLLSFSSIQAATHFDNDGKADLGVYRVSNRTWYNFLSSSGEMTAVQFGLETDVLTPGDYDGDGITDIAVWRPSNGFWYVLRSSSNQLFMIQWGTTIHHQFGSIADIPVPADYDGDGHDDLAVYRPDYGSWYVLESSQEFDPAYAQISQFGKLGDVPVPADYDGDGKADIAVYRTPEARWYIWESKNGNLRSTRFGQSGYDLLVPADYTGDGKADVAVFRSGVWIIERSEDHTPEVFYFGTAGDTPVPADYDGDGRTDPAVFRNGTWYVSESSSSGAKAANFGSAGDLAVGAAYVRESIVAVP